MFAATREIYWNVGHSVILPMYLLVVVAFIVLGYGFCKRFLYWREGKPLNRFDCYEQRVNRLIKELYGQTKVWRVKEAGVYHALFFWSFLVLFAGTLLIMLQADFLTPLLKVNLLQGEFYKAFSLLLDLAGLVALIMLAALFVRRFIIQPEGLETTDDDYRIYALLFAILITGFLVEGARMAATEMVTNRSLALFSPVGMLVAMAMGSISADGLLMLHKTFWWLHFALVIGFFIALPYTKLRHILLVPANSFFAPLEEKGTIVTINLEDEDTEQFGTATASDLTWKDRFDADSCVSCKRCQDVCPAYNTDKPLSPMQLIKQLGEATETGQKVSLTETVGEAAIWSCTTCAACQDICPANNEHLNKIMELRRNLALMEGTFPGEEVRTAISHLEINGNPFGMTFAARADWAKGLSVARLDQGEAADILYFTGCYASFDKRNQQIARNFITICNTAGIKVGIMGKQEKCCGEPARKLGNEYLYQILAAENIATLKSSNIKKIVTTCPHCFNTLSRDYKDLGLDIETEHFTTYINQLIHDGTVALSKGQPQICTYHDSCYLGRYKDIISAPREIIAAAGWQLKEMDKSAYDSFCCGAGGGRIFAEENLGSRINVARVSQAEITRAPVLVSNCPFCLTMFEDGIKTGGYEETLEVRDLSEIIVERIGGSA